MKVKLIIAVVMMFTAPLANAVVFNGGGQVKIIRLHDAGQFTDVDWIGVEGFSGAGSCLTNSGVVVLRIRADSGGKNILATALTARALGQDVLVSVDDDVKDANNACYLRYLNLR